MLSIKKIKNRSNLLLIYGMYEKAKILLSFHNSGQWQNIEPSIKTLVKDIEEGNFFGLFQNDQLVGTCAILNHDASYLQLTHGAWLNEDSYKVIHRFVIDSTFHQQGLGSTFMALIEQKTIEEGVFNIRVDTHQRNIPMTNLLIKNRYIQCGEAFIEGAGPRMVYHKELRKHHETIISK